MFVGLSLTVFDLEEENGGRRDVKGGGESIRWARFLVMKDIDPFTYLFVPHKSILDNCFPWCC